MSDDPQFDVGAFLARPLVARVATSDPTVRPVWYLWEDDAFWWLSGAWSRLPDRLLSDPAVALVVDTCDLRTGEIRQVTVTGTADVHAYDAGRARRLLRRYLGDDEQAWDPRFDPNAASGGVLIRLVPERITARDRSYQPSHARR